MSCAGKYSRMLFNKDTFKPGDEVLVVTEITGGRDRMSIRRVVRVGKLHITVEAGRNTVGEPIETKFRFDGREPGQGFSTVRTTLKGHATQEHRDEIQRRSLSFKAKKQLEALAVRGGYFPKEVSEEVLAFCEALKAKLE